MSGDNNPDPKNETDGEGKTEEESDDNTTEDGNSTGKNKLRFRAYDLEVEAESEEASFGEMADVLTTEFDKIRKDALIGEYEEIERENLHSVILGGGD
ncbi:hypothetical protein [Halolamina salifodinae]|uniref:Uncharacterized protein n=1 Tax=Halolamina salifodinae TaxID=1202767 RepID=A0A8T4GZI9_9EURY|nr:hypothetical protein [Halolamina salifodinae]MBP1986964.1 hypothetical protein [Halolamina salifodinae]